LSRATLGEWGCNRASMDTVEDQVWVTGGIAYVIFFYIISAGVHFLYFVEVFGFA
jgi:hypothetical protein